MEDRLVELQERRVRRNRPRVRKGRDGIPALGLAGSWSLLPPALLAVFALGFVLVHAFRARARIEALPAIAAAIVLAAASWIVATRYTPLPRPMEIYFQAHLLKQLDEPRRAGAKYEEAVAALNNLAFSASELSAIP